MNAPSWFRSNEDIVVLLLVKHPARTPAGKRVQALVIERLEKAIENERACK